MLHRLVTPKATRSELWEPSSVLMPTAPPLGPPPTKRWILDPRLGGFPFPLTLTASHMVFCSAATIAMAHGGAVARPPPINRDLFLRTVVPIGALFATALWLGNTAYVYLSVSFVQMLKARVCARALQLAHICLLTVACK